MRSCVDLHGTIVATDTVKIGSSRGYRCILDDGARQLDLLFLGRSQIRGLTVGVDCRVSGRVAVHQGRPSIWNPRYQLDPRPTDATAPTTSAIEPAPRQFARRDERVSATGYFRVYLGMCAGVGKTYAMLSEGRRLATEDCDVVIGLVTTHERPQTQEQLLGLEVLPPKVVRYHGARFEEMDLDAILARRPDLTLVDELAHSNIPGGRNDKRWQDVLDLLDASINVFTTVNVQHIESLAGAVEQISGISVPERVPDAVLRRADQIELVDCSPELLRRRMLDGNIYPPERVQGALAGFFKSENLRTLRELTTRFVADETDGDLLDELRRSRLDAVRHPAERVLAGVTVAPGTDAVMRRAAQIAARFEADLHVVHVAPIDTRPHEDSVAALRELAEKLGAHWTQIRAEDPVHALMRLASDLQITQIVLGPSHRTRWQEFVGGGSTVRRLTRLAGAAGIDVHVIVRPGDGRVDADLARHE
jgi:two-component system, OmpR family, sensor histidine kinase KdpD